MSKEEVLPRENINGVVLDKEQRNLGKVAGSYVIRPPKDWIKKRFKDWLLEPLLDIRLVVDERGRRLLVIEKAKKEE